MGDVVRDEKTAPEVVGLFQLFDGRRNVLGQAALTVDNMLVMLPLVTEAEKNGQACEYPSTELIIGVEQVTAKKRRIENSPTLIGKLAHWPRPIPGNVDIIISPG